MTEIVTAKHRIVHVAKDLNISHRDIIAFLDTKGLQVKSHMTPLDEESYQLVIEEFEKDLQTVERYRKEKTRKEIHSRMVEEKMSEGSSLEILMPDEAEKLDGVTALDTVQLSGSLSLETNEGKGTTFRIKLDKISS